MKSLIIGNWKMNPVRKKDAVKLFSDIQNIAGKIKNLSIVAAVPFPFLHSVRKTQKLLLGAQDVTLDTGVPHTGGVSLAMLTDAQVSHCIVGHSERRKEGETNETVGAKVVAILKAGLTPVLCIGETERDHSGKYLGFVETQLSAAFVSVTRSQLARCVVAYEPVWAISRGDGKGQTATPDNAHEMKLFIQKFLVGKYGRTAAMRVPILYGGSVNPENVRVLLNGEIDGFLVGGASLDAKKFGLILNAAASYERH